MEDARWQRLGKLHVWLNKTASTAVTSYGLQGRLIRSGSGWILLEVPNALVRGAFGALNEPGIELPSKDTNDPNGTLRAHISVMRPEELAAIGNPTLTELGQRFNYTLGPIKTCQPAGWDDVSRVWFIEVQSPALKLLRKSYGLSPLPNQNKFEFHITVAIRRRHVLGTNTVAKHAEWLQNLPENPNCDLNTWRAFPAKIAAAVTQLAPLAADLRKLPELANVPAVFFHPEQGVLRAWTKDAAWTPPPAVRDCPALRAYPWLVSTELPPDILDYRLLKLAQTGYMKPVADAWQAAALPLGGTHPLATMLLGGLLASGVGYAGGKVLDAVLPEEYFDKGVAPLGLAALGGALGAAPGAAYGLLKYRTNPKTGLPFSHQGAGWTSTYPWPRPWPWASAKKAGVGNTGNLLTKTIPVDAFNRVVWNDVRAVPNPFGTKDRWGDNEQPLHTPAPVAAATTGLLSGTAALLGNATHVSPFDVALTAANTGLQGWTYGLAAGKVLGTMAGLKPDYQRKLQQAGIWGGLLTGTVKALFGGS